MYWPLGAPRVYASAGRSAVQHRGPQDQPSAEESWMEDDHLLGLCVGRSQQLFVTITAAAVGVWQVSVRPSSRSRCHF